MKDEEPIDDETGTRKPYRKPELTQVPLRPEEAVLGNCKISGTAGPARSSCTSLYCNAIGS